MSFTPDLSRLAGRGLVIAALVSSAVGYAFTTGHSALVVAAPMQAVGAVALCAVMLFTGRNPFRRYPAVMWLWISLLAGGNAAVAYSYPYAVDHLTLGTVAAVVVIGYLLVGIEKIWPYRTTTYGLQHICGRVLVGFGVVMLNRPSPGESVGMLWALISALCVWNTVTMLGQMKKHGLEDQGAAVANLIAAVLLLALVFKARGNGWISLDLFYAAGPAGLLTLVLPVVCVNAALRRSSTQDVGIMQSFSSPVHALVGMAGAALGWIDSDQRLALFPEWAGIILITVAAFAVSLLKEPAGGAVRVGTQSSGG
ncbi:hypothetical protein AB0C87_00815 [Actinomadura sp. NPDC048021]|uniref:hypothetical protein n=1 Tax=Actinomadura sp. NPDC048021 TaxID=3155385 RepID=UPI0033D052ED